MSQKTHPSLASKEIAEIGERLDDLSTRGTLIYESKDQTIHRFQTSDRELIAKTYHQKSLRNKGAALVRNTRAHRSYRAGIRFSNAGIKTPKPLLLLEKGSPFRHTISLVTEFCPHPALLDSINQGLPIHPSTPAKILTLIHQLASLKSSHGDFHARNLLIDDEGNPNLIDLDGVRSHILPLVADKYILKDRNRFLRSLEPLPEQYLEFSKVLGESNSPLPPSPSS